MTLLHRVCLDSRRGNPSQCVFKSANTVQILHYHLGQTHTALKRLVMHTMQFVVTEKYKSWFSADQLTKSSRNLSLLIDH